MAAGTFTLYSKNKNNLTTASLAGATVKLALVTSSYTPDVTVAGHSLWSDASANEISAAFGYTAGGVTLGTLASTAITGGYKFSSANGVWTASAGSIAAWRYGIIYLSGTVYSLVNPLVGYFVGDNTPADIPATSGTLTVTANASGWFDVT
jgi:hypothetical protein